MNTISTAIAKAIDAHATELILLVAAVPFLIAYWRTRDQMIGTMLGGIIGGLLTICTKRATTNVENVTVDQTTDAQPPKPAPKMSLDL